MTDLPETLPLFSQEPSDSEEEKQYGLRADVSLSAAIKAWGEASKTAEGAQAYLDKYVHGVKDHDEYMKLIGEERMKQCVDLRERR